MTLLSGPVLGVRPDFAVAVARVLQTPEKKYTNNDYFGAYSRNVTYCGLFGSPGKVRCI